ncbi:MAG: circadian clock protein KaiC [Deltaproteobacteria bacterium]|nr:circadian clock protein KaiC [Deltaproteobacteria bacterium]MBW2046979.1 circadian clock protein KaiC [Deltaproteobacteria bacterium]MBW2109862.1 circadian clock protein KaiC [Deltaproteobacteria bacterium]MBW2352523.1 circadian clock protein KaiC [Deltaproteobacteria bacterium]
MEHDSASKQTPTAKALEKAPTHIPGLDEILQGGLPRGRTTIVRGGAGSGKTLLGLEFLYRGALAGEPGIFVGFEEPVEQVRENAATLGWDLPALERENRLFLLEGHVKPDTLVSGDFSLKGLLASVSGKSKELGAKRIVIDSLEVALRLFDAPQQVRNEMHVLNDWLQTSGLSAILTVRPSSRGGASAYEDFFDSMGDCIIDLDVRSVDQVSTRRLRLVKYRGSGFGRNEYPYVITKTGLHTAPISTVGLRHKPLGEKITTGNARLDEILCGGYRRAACILIAGLPGTGKTILASTFIAATCDRDENVLYIGFEESESAMIENVLNAGVTLRPHVDSGRLACLTNYPEAMGAEEHYIGALARIDALRPDHVVVDAISACQRMGGKRAAFDYLMRLLNACKERGITTLLINQLSGSTQHMEISGNNISSMVDTVIFLSYHEGLGETNRQLQILKSRGSAHSNQKSEYRITDDGIRIMDVYLGRGDVLMGTARLRQEESDRAEAERLAFDIEAQELELKRLKLAQEQAAQGAKIRGEMRSKNISDTRWGEG